MKKNINNINFKKSDFYFELPDHLIAQTPVEPRDCSRLLCLDRENGMISDNYFYNITDYFEKGDTLILNDSRVLPARLFGKISHSNADAELLLLKQKQPNIWEVLVKPGKKLRMGAKIIFGTELSAEIIDITESGNRIAEFKYESKSGENFYNILDRIGNMPLPPYITAKLNDKERYQTVYSKDPGSAAAPTAGLHFTNEILDKLTEKGVNIAYVTLHVGLGTFRPVKEEIITNHIMHSEHYLLPENTAEIINTTKKNGKKIIAAGTTSCRTLESAAQKSRFAANGKITASAGDTDIFIYPGYEFQIVDALITNFHLPESTLIMLVSAFAGYENTMSAYKYAIAEKYRFFSFGDAMLIK